MFGYTLKLSKSGLSSRRVCRINPNITERGLQQPYKEFSWCTILLIEAVTCQKKLRITTDRLHMKAKDYITNQYDNSNLNLGNSKQRKTCLFMISQSNNQTKQ